MKIVSSVFRDVIHHGTRIAAVLRAVIRQHLDLSNSVLITEEDHRTANGSVVVALSVELEIVIAGALTVRRELRSALIAETGVPSGHDAGCE